MEALMRSLLLAALVLAGGASVALASPLAVAHLAFTPSLVHSIRRKPWHEGGPPWTRRGRGDRRDDDFDERRYERRRVTRCVTRYDERFDLYRGVYVRRPV